MSRVAKAPVAIPAGVEVKLNGQEITVKGAKVNLLANLTTLLLSRKKTTTLLSVHAKVLLTHGHKQVLHVH